MTEKNNSGKRHPRLFSNGFFKKLYPANGEAGSIIKRIRSLQDTQVDRRMWSLVAGSLNLAERKVRDIMIPRSNVVMLHEDDPLDAVRKNIIESGHSRFPVVDEFDKVLGVLYAKDLLTVDSVEDFEIHNILRQPYLVPGSKRSLALMEEFRANRVHMGIVVDEYGQMDGLITIEDVIEEIVGEIEDEYDNPDENTMQKYGSLYKGKRVFLPASTSVEEFNKVFGAKFDPNQAETIGGVLIKGFGRVPRPSEKIDLEGFTFVVERSDNRRISRLSLTTNENTQLRDT